MGRPGLVGTVARTAVIAGTATAVSGGMMRHSANKQQQQAEAQAYEQQQAAAAQQAQIDAAVQQQMAAQAAAAPAPDAAAPAEDPTITKLKELAALHDQGILSDEEFASAKAKLLT
jgi:hypothetical protein